MLPPEDWKGVRDIDRKVEAPNLDFMNKDDEDWNDDEEDQDISADIGNASLKANWSQSEYFKLVNLVQILIRLSTEF